MKALTVSCWAALLALPQSALCSLTKNLNYRSPSLSHRHSHLGIALHKVRKRHDEASEALPVEAPDTHDAKRYNHFDPNQLRFLHGVASGDPYHDSVILWTRVTPPSEGTDNAAPLNNVYLQGMVQVYSQTMKTAGFASGSPICLYYRIALDEKLEQVVDEGRVETSSDIDYTAKVEAKNLKPFTDYYYVFHVCDNPSVRSPVGKTKTLPLPDARVDRPIVVPVFSCANYPFGFFNAYSGPLRQKPGPDYVIHLGDYIYEHANGDYGNGKEYGRLSKPDHEIVSLQDYRIRFAQHREDADLQALHTAAPWITTWDDHEIADNTYRDGAAGMNNTEDSFEQFGGISFDTRKANAVRAYYEWMPLRQVDMNEKLRIWRNFSVGNLFDLVMPDTRVYDRAITDLYWNIDYIEKISNDKNRSIMGERQENWFFDQLSYSSSRGAAWRLVGNQVLLSAFDLSANYGKHPFYLDTWAGYRGSLNRTLDHIRSRNISDTLILSGDSHSAWAADIPYPYPLRPPPQGHEYESIAVEFGGTAVSSPPAYFSWRQPKRSIPEMNKVSDAYLRDNFNMVYAEGWYRGWFDLQVGYDKTTARFWGIDETKKDDKGDRLLATFEVERGKNKIGKRWRGDDKGSGSLKEEKWKGG